jgi:hypothetical protein
MTEKFIKDNFSNEDQKLFLEIYEDLKSLTDFWMRKPWSKTLENFISFRTNFGMIMNNNKSSDQLERKRLIQDYYIKK